MMKKIEIIDLLVTLALIVIRSEESLLREEIEFNGRWCDDGGPCRD